MCYFIEITRNRKKHPMHDPVHICRVDIDFARSGTMMAHLAETAFPPAKGYNMKLFRKDVCCRAIDPAPSNHNIHM